MSQKFNYDKWHKIYLEKSLIRVIDYLSDDEILILSKLGIVIEDKKYTNYEFDSIEEELIMYYRNNEMLKEELENILFVEEKGILFEDYLKVLEKFKRISKLYKL